MLTEKNVLYRVYIVCGLCEEKIVYKFSCKHMYVKLRRLN